MWDCRLNTGSPCAGFRADRGRLPRTGCIGNKVPWFRGSLSPIGGLRDILPKTASQAPSKNRAIPTFPLGELSRRHGISITSHADRGRIAPNQEIAKFSHINAAVQAAPFGLPFTPTPNSPMCEPNLTKRHPHRPNRRTHHNPTRHRVSQSLQSDGRPDRTTTTGTSQPPPCEPNLTGDPSGSGATMHRDFFPHGIRSREATLTSRNTVYGSIQANPCITVEL
ncbi:hypothetical protein BTHE_0818 [Bifidobacterium thermophilum]|nr:hypothetical protein BTHE_0818 [Bifidobacterium thermophilum]